jgi:polyisoprenoid-binding protein YceI
VSTQVIAPGRYRIDPTRTTIRFRTAHLFGLGPVEGTFTLVEGTITLADEPTRAAVLATVDAASFRTDKARRDADVRSRKFLDADRHPTITFAGRSLARAGDGGWRLRGDLTVRGTVCSVELSIVDHAVTPSGHRFTATARVDRYACGVTTARGVVGRYLYLTMDVCAAATDGE